MTARRLCGAKTRSGGKCTQAAGWGTDHAGFGSCKLHGGSVRNGRVAAAREEAEAEVLKLGVAIETDPHAALATAVGILAGQVRFLQAKAAKLEDGEGLEEGELAPVVRTLNGVLEQWARISKAAVDAGVAERQVTLDEQQVGKFATAMRAVLDVLDLDADAMERARAELAAQLETLDVFGERPRELAA